MEIKTIINRDFSNRNSALCRAYCQFDNLLTELRKRQLPGEVVLHINRGVDWVNLASNIELKRVIKKVQTDTLKLIEKRLKLVPRNYYRNTWMATGLATFGLPIGVIFGILNDNMAMLGFGLPVGLLVGMAVGASMDKKASMEGRQLNIEIKG